MLSLRKSCSVEGPDIGQEECLGCVSSDLVLCCSDDAQGWSTPVSLWLQHPSLTSPSQKGSPENSTGGSGHDPRAKELQLQPMECTHCFKPARLSSSSTAERERSDFAQNIGWIPGNSNLNHISLTSYFTTMQTENLYVSFKPVRAPCLFFNNGMF